MSEENGAHGNSTNSAANGVTHFLRHFSPRNKSTDGSQMNALHRFRNLGRKALLQAPSTGDSTVSPVSVTVPWNQPTRFTKKNMSGKLKGEEEVITFDGSSEAKRLGICPTCYDVPETFPIDATPSKTSHQEVCFVNHENVNHDSNTPTLSLPNLFSSVAIWEESCRMELESSEPQVSPQKSLGSLDSDKSDGMNDEYDCSVSISRPTNPRSVFRNNNSNLSSGGSVSSVLMSKAKAIVQRAREKENYSSASGRMSRSLSPMPTSSKSVSAPDTTLSATVKIFLLLVEPKSKVFELIQLVYPRKNTKVSDLLKMIPKNATENTLGMQAYVGITRPKRRADPIININLLASNSVYNTCHPTAGIGQGEIIVAIPARASTKEIVILAKQILASSHIQKLIAKSKEQGGASEDSGRKGVKKRRGSKDGSIGSGTSPKSSSQSSKTFTPRKATSVEAISEEEKIVCNTARSPKVVTFLNENCTDELKRAIDNANVANEEAGRSPCQTPTPFLSESVVVGSASSKDKTLSFPRDMLDAYLSKDAVVKMCSTPNSNKIPNIECTSSSSMVDDTGDADSDDDALSCDGSMSSSFHSWTQSLDNSAFMLAKKAAAFEEQEITAWTRQQQLRKKKRNALAKQVKRLAVTIFVVSIIRYHLDPNGMNATDNQRQIVLHQPMGIIGFLQFFLSFAVFLKLQIFYRLSKTNPRPRSRCPTMRLISKVHKTLYGSHVYSGAHEHTVPTDIQAIKFA
jgi:hypothetical protein